MFGLSVLSVTGTSREGRGGSCEKLFLAIPFPWDSEPLGFSSPPPSRPFLGPWHARMWPGIKTRSFPQSYLCAAFTAGEKLYTAIQLRHQDHQFHRAESAVC